jgi:hypothetical protein
MTNNSSNSGFDFCKCGRAIGVGVCLGCAGLMSFYGGRPGFQLDAVPSAYEKLTLYKMPGKGPGNGPDDGHYEVTSTSTGNVSTGAWGHALVGDGPVYLTTDPSSGMQFSGANPQFSEIAKMKSLLFSDGKLRFSEFTSTKSS